LLKAKKYGSINVNALMPLSQNLFQRFQCPLQMWQKWQIALFAEIFSNLPLTVNYFEKYHYFETQVHETGVLHVARV